MPDSLLKLTSWTERPHSDSTGKTSLIHLYVGRNPLTRDPKGKKGIAKIRERGINIKI